MICLMLLAVPVVMADADVDELQLFWKNGEMVLKINAAGSYQFSHQIEEAKDGKNFRIIVDIFPAIHMLGQKAFHELPASIVQSIRTSQYSIEPTKTVRVVMDLDRESVYRIEKAGNSVFVYIPENEISSFPAWSSNGQTHITPGQPEVRPEPEPVRAEKSVPALQKSPAPVNLPDNQTQEIETTEVASWEPETTYYQARQSNLMDREMSRPSPSATTIPDELPLLAVSDEPEANPKTAQPEPVKDEPVQKKKQPSPKPVDRDSVEKSPVAKDKTVLAEKLQPKDNPPAPAPKVVNKPAEKEPVDTPQQGTPEANVSTEPPATKPLVLNDDDEAVRTEPTREEVTRKPTSRFRREPAIPAKLKGTIVAEFPKRMVIKYTPGNSRDPFASLIDETKKTDGPLFKKLPDVETAKLVGILESTDGQNRALLEDIDGYGFILKPGDKVKKGYVSQIYTNKALFQLFEYGWSRTVALNLEDGE